MSSAIGRIVFTLCGCAASVSWAHCMRMRRMCAHKLIKVWQATIRTASIPFAMMANSRENGVRKQINLFACNCGNEQYARPEITFSIFNHIGCGTYGCGCCCGAPFVCRKSIKNDKIDFEIRYTRCVHVAWRHARFLHVSHQQFRHQVNGMNDGEACVEDVRRLKLSNCSLDDGDLSHTFRIDGNICECGRLAYAFHSTFFFTFIVFARV